MQRKRMALLALLLWGGLQVLGMGIAFAQTNNASPTDVGHGVSTALQQLENATNQFNSTLCSMVNGTLRITVFVSASAAVLIGAAIRALAPAARIWSFLVWGGVIAGLIVLVVLPAIAGMLGGGC